MSKPFLAMLTVLILATRASAAAPLPPDVSREPWFTSHCRPLGAERVSHYPDVMNHRITYAWQSALGYLWERTNDVQPGDAADYCVRMALYGEHGRLIENITMLCSVNARGKRTETWTFGNAEVAKRLCPMGSDQLKAADARSDVR